MTRKVDLEEIRNVVDRLKRRGEHDPLSSLEADSDSNELAHRLLSDLEVTEDEADRLIEDVVGVEPLSETETKAEVARVLEAQHARPPVD